MKTRSKFSPSQYFPFWQRLLISILGSIFFRFPFFSFQLGVAHLQNKEIWTHQFEVPCISDCRIYGELAEGFDASGHYRWTYFPVWPKLVQIFRESISPHLSGYSAAVILSWVVGVLAGAVCLWYFDHLWKSDEKTLGFGKKAWLVLFFISIYPHGHFWFQGYSEPLFISSFLLGLLAAGYGQYIFASLLIGLSAVIRPQGVWLVPIWGCILVILFLKKKISWQKTGLSGLLSGLGLAGLLFWYWKETGDFFYYYKIQAQGGYGRSFKFLEGIWNHRPRWDVAVLYLYLSLWGSIRLIRRNDLPSRWLGWISLIFTEIPLFFGGFYSYVRFLSVTPALFVLLAEKSEKSQFLKLLFTVFFMTKLAVQIYKSGFHEWVG